jgi:hypothetical protein
VLRFGKDFEDFREKGTVVGVSPFSLRVFVGDASEAFAADEGALSCRWRFSLRSPRC